VPAPPASWLGRDVDLEGRYSAQTAAWPAGCDDETGSWTSRGVTVERPNSFVGGGHLDPEECDRFETALQRLIGNDPDARAQWAKGWTRRRAS
jgi:hypothetical protein